MVLNVNSDVRVHPDAEALSRAVARALLHRITEITRDGTRFSLALAGGSTPRTLYRVLAAEYRDKIPWAQVDLFWGDERYVSWDDQHSNYRLVRETLLDHVPIPGRNVHPMPTDFPEPDEAALAYERTLRNRFSGPWPRMDLILLGMGADGHTASLFPGSPALGEQKRWVVAVQGPAEPRVRLTLTLPVLNCAASVFLLVTGAEKADALRRALTGSPDPSACPAGAVRPAGGALVWWVDEKAAMSVRDSSAREK
jgi:6-phosphogluconolactonase